MDGTCSSGSGSRGEIKEPYGDNGFTNGEAEQRRTNGVFLCCSGSLYSCGSESQKTLNHEHTKARKHESTKFKHAARSPLAETQAPAAMPGSPARQPRWGGVPSRGRAKPRRGISESSRRGGGPAASAKKRDAGRGDPPRR